MESLSGSIRSNRSRQTNISASQKYYAKFRVIPCQITRWSHGWHLRFYWNLNHMMPCLHMMKTILSWKFQFYSLYGLKIITIWFLPKIGQNCLHQRQARFSQLWSQITNQWKKQSKFGPPAVFHPIKSFFYDLSLKVLRFGGKLCQKC